MEEKKAKKKWGKWVLLAFVLFGLIGGAMEAFSGGDDLISVVGMTVQETQDELGEPTQVEGFFLIYDSFACVSNVSGIICSVSITGGEKKLVGVSIGDDEDEVADRMKEEGAVLFSEKIEEEDDGQQYLCRRYSVQRSSTIYKFSFSLDPDTGAVKKMNVIAS